MINQPLARLVALQFRQTGNVPQQPVPILRIYLRAPDGDMHTHDLPNGGWTVDNAALQFLAKWGYRPSDIGEGDSTMRDCEPDTTVVPVVPDGDGSYLLAQHAMKDAESALRESEWFDGGDNSTEQETAEIAAGGQIDKDGGPSVQRAARDSDSGVVVTTERESLTEE